MIKTLTVKTSSREEFVDITDEVERAVRDREIKNGVCYLYVPHTTAGITINEGADPSVKKDIINALKKIAPYAAGYLHMEGNADSHIKTTIVGSSAIVFIENGTLVLGQWQSIFFCEFDGPRTRKVYLKIIKEE
ncbi:secondary thiamine-phosphate synthase enzyme [Thermodesulfovibrio aggregans]|uniref:Secondary thiamine-phosphate synthase enzyme n=1 Tax=Thermodesulfovibrio aggregans TaxID=86166 RepID=A0A0U9HQX7_9BACT|nr:secondary thiamine-phosphate synthase enzyme YjbQ [Thermodesulfovibrio aggregans]GAQ94562.1 secondary thiamine-phosphate synthase enzyme [Thermodesulfovibrio aggregans]